MNILNRPLIKMDAKNFIWNDTKFLKMFFATIIIYLLDRSVYIGYSIYDRINSTGIMYFNDFYNKNRTDMDGRSIGVTVVSLILIPFMVSIAGYYLNHIRGFNPDWRSLYKEGFDNYGKYLVVKLVTNIIICLWTVLLIVPGIIKGIAYSQVDYIIHDNNKLSPSEARRMSDIMTQGYKGDLFVLGLSFIPWYLLMSVFAFIPSIYVIPYTRTVYAMYYENLKKNAIDTGRIAPEAFGLVADNFNNVQNQDVEDNGIKSTFFVPNSENTFNPDITVPTSAPVNETNVAAETFTVEEPVNPAPTKVEEQTNDNPIVLNGEEVHKDDIDK